MKTLIVYDSFFGNTEQIAKSIGISLGSKENVEVLHVEKVKPEQLVGINLLIVGSPTRAFKPTKSITNFLNEIPPDLLKGVKVAAFDTRISTEDANSRILNGFVRIFGYAAKPIADKLQKKGGTLISQPEGFFVKDSKGPLKENENERAEKWGSTLNG